ncbi:hypothetical protein PGN35_000415 [Nodosilinea sp. PGN35]|uniref:hypothetical protein n=1 Tax=Nodosilinea sp. PGN35 TaxID=3020489 RepID=UPI0023B22280|nr:hypothetical protein [Nodosilinea sp. TSF1-S3]MDF0369123.1 hypothetical protein [Nodosilinea sp. TSF1-S3]
MPWRSLGAIQPRVSGWRDYRPATPPAAGAAVFRVSPKNLSVGVIFRTYALVRFRSVQEGREIVTRARRVYPRPEPMVIDAEIPREVRGTGVQWVPQVMKMVYRNFIGSTNDGKWVLEVEEFVRTAAPPELAADNDTTPYWDREDTTLDVTDVLGFD